MDENRLSEYSVNGKANQKDTDGNVLSEYLPFCMRHVLSECPDFKNKISAMEELVEKLSDENNTVMIDVTPKFHCELAHQGIAYSWGMSKRHYLRKPLEEKKGAANIRNSITASLDHVKIQHARAFSAKTRRYMLAYKKFDQDQDGERSRRSATFAEIERFMKTEAKTHRSAADQDTVYIAKTYRESLSI
jgi:hypothetical protein